MFSSAAYWNGMLKAITLVTRFGFIFILAKFLEPEQIGVYGVFSVGVVLASICLGLEFHQYATRQIVTEDRYRCGWVVKNQLLVYSLVYLLMIPLFIVLLYGHGVSNVFIVFFITIVLLEHINDEICRLMIALSSPVLSTVLLAVRQVGWTFAVPIMMYLYPETRDLNYVFWGWIISASVAMVLGVYLLLRRKVLQNWTQNISLAWIVKGLKITFPLFLTIVLVKSLFTLDRYLLQSLSSFNVVAAYMIFAGLARSIFLFVDASIINVHTPRLVELAHQHDLTAFKRLSWSMGRQYMLLVGVWIFAVWLMMPVLLGWINQPVYFEYRAFIYPIMLAYALYSLSEILYLVLYALKKDMMNVICNLLAFISFGVSVWVFKDMSADYAVVWSLCVAFSVMLVLRVWGVVRVL